MLSIQTFTFNTFAENTYVVSDDTRQGVIIDPGCYSRSEQEELISYIEEKEIRIMYILNTHGHIDHVLGNYFVTDKYKAPVLIHKCDEATLRSVNMYASLYGFNAYRGVNPDRFFEENDGIAFGNTLWKVLFLPGHSPGHVGFYDEAGKIIFSGDVLFDQSIGRTDLPGGDFDTLISSIHQKLFALPDKVVVYPGHGPTTTIGKEKKSNPFCALSLHS